MDARLHEYIHLFNEAQDYFECHEVGESLWLDSGRPIILKGLIQAAVCLYHLHNGNIRGGYRMWQRAKQYMADELPVYETMRLDQLISDIDHVFSLVPATLYTAIVPSRTVDTWDLPTVRIQLTEST